MSAFSCIGQRAELTDDCLAFEEDDVLCLPETGSCSDASFGSYNSSRVLKESYPGLVILLVAKPGVKFYLCGYSLYA